MEQTHALGRRKAAVARVYLTAGSGNVTVNGRPLENYFALESLRYIVNQPFEVTNTLGQFDVKVTIVGGGIRVRQRLSVLVLLAPSVSWIGKHIVQHSRQQVSSLAMLAKLSVRSQASQVHVAASSSASVSYYFFTAQQWFQTILKMAATLRKR